MPSMTIRSGRSSSTHHHRTGRQGGHARKAEHAATRADFRASFPWAEPPPHYIDLCSDDDDNMEVKLSTKEDGSEIK